MGGPDLNPNFAESQDIYGYLPPEALNRISEKTGIPLKSNLWSSTFYSQFYLTRRGKHIIRQCDGTACHVRGAGKITDTIQNQLGIQAGETSLTISIPLKSSTVWEPAGWHR